MSARIHTLERGPKGGRYVFLLVESNDIAHEVKDELNRQADAFGMALGAHPWAGGLHPRRPGLRQPAAVQEVHRRAHPGGRLPGTLRLRGSLRRHLTLGQQKVQLCLAIPPIEADGLPLGIEDTWRNHRPGLYAAEPGHRDLGPPPQLPKARVSRRLDQLRPQSPHDEESRPKHRLECPPDTGPAHHFRGFSDWLAGQ